MQRVRVDGNRFMQDAVGTQSFQGDVLRCHMPAQVAVADGSVPGAEAGETWYDLNRFSYLGRLQVMTASGAWWDAVRVHASLSSGGVLHALPMPVPGPVVEQGENAVGVFASSGGAPMKYARYYAMDVRLVPAGPQMVVGSPQFVTGYLLGSIVMLSPATGMGPREGPFAMSMGPP